MECDFQMQEPLVNIGMCDMFEEKADFSGFSRQRNGLRVSKIFQKCVFEVNEEGAEAITVTSTSLFTH
jgi:serine protease inhibitor